MKTWKLFALVILTPFALLLYLTSSVSSAPPVSPTSQSGTAVHIPFTYDPLIGQGIVVQVRIGKHKPLPFLVDTGAEAPVALTRWAAKKLAFPTNGPSVTLNPGNKIGYAIPPQEVALLGTKLDGDWITHQVTVIVADFHFGQLAGIIGLPLLKSANLQIDFSQHQLRFLPLEDALSIPTGAIEVVLRPSANPALYDAVLPDLPGMANPSEKLSLMLDTGSEDTLLPPALIPNLHPVVATLYSLITLAGSENISYFLLPTLKLGPISADNILVGEAPSSHGHLGIHTLSHFIVTLDWSALRMWLTPSYLSSPIPNATDIQLTEMNGHILVDQVAPGSPAENAGLSSGQIVMSVDGHDTRGLDIDTVEATLNGFARTNAKITVEDGKRQRNLVFMRRRLDDPAAYDGFGMRLVHRERARTGWYVKSLLCTSLAYQHGVRPGDVITAVGKTNIEAMPLPAVEQILREAAAGTELAVQRSVELPLPETKGNPTDDHLDLSKLSPDLRKVIETLLKEGWSMTKESDGTFSMMPPPKGGPLNTNNGGVNSGNAGVQKK